MTSSVTVASRRYPVLYEKPEEFVAQYKFTALLLPSGNTARITAGPPVAANSENKVEDEALIELLSQETGSKKKNKKKNSTQTQGSDHRHPQTLGARACVPSAFRRHSAIALT